MEDNKSQQETPSKTKNSLLTNPILMGLLAIIGLPLGIYSICLTFAFNKEAKPVYKVLSDVMITEGLPDSKIKVIYDSVEVQNVRAVTIILWNAGNDFLSKNSFSKDRPIAIKCDKAVSILEFSMVKTSRTDLKFTKTLVIDDVNGTPTDTTLEGYDTANLEIQGDDGLEANDGGTFQIVYTTVAKDCQWFVDARIKGTPEGFIMAKGTDDQIIDRQKNLGLIVMGLLVGTMFCFMFLSLNKLNLFGSYNKTFIVIN